MTKVDLLDCLCKVVREDTKDLILPTALQKGDVEQNYRAADIYKMRLQDSSDPYKKVPYILVRVFSGTDQQNEGRRPESTAVIRMTFTTYNNRDEGVGELMLLNLMERVRIGLEKRVIIGDLYELNLKEGITFDIYDGIKAPYFAGEMVTVWNLPAIQREDVRKWL